MSVPEDIAVSGYDDIALVDRLDPALTTISLPYEEMGDAAARLLLDLMGEDDRVVRSSYEPVKLAPKLIVRASTSPPLLKDPISRSTKSRPDESDR
jgi:LacI family transcriptional regulator